MVRKCIVSNCTSSDITILSHRFPRNKKLATKWQETLNVQHTSINDLFNRHVVCTKHFKKSDYRNPVSNHLNYTAIPTCDLIEEASIESESEYEMIELLEEIDGLVEQPSTEDCEEDEEHLEFSNVNDEHSDDNGSNIETTTESETGRETIEETIDLYVEEEDQDISSIQYESIEINLNEENNEKTSDIEIIEQEITNHKQNNIVEEQPCKKRKLDSPIEIQESDFCQKNKIETRKEVIPEIKNVEIETGQLKNDEGKPLSRILEKKSKITEDDEESDDEDSNFKKLSRSELIKKVKNQSKKITELEKKVKSYQKKMTVSMKTIKQLMLGNSDDDDSDDDFL